MLTPDEVCVLSLPDEPFTRQEKPHMRGKKIDTIKLRIDQEFIEALATLQELHPNVTKSELIRASVIEQVRYETGRRRRTLP